MARPAQNYETVMIIRPTLGEEATNALIEKFKALIASAGTVDEVEDWGKRRLAYEIDDETEGYYVFIKFTASPELPEELDRVYNITDGILRSLIVAKEQ